VNDYIDFFLKAGQLPSIAEKGAKVEREIKLRKSRIDFHMGNTYVEVKTPLTTLPLGKSARHVKMAKFNSFDRLIRHFSDLSNAMSLGSRAIVLLCYLYNAEPFRPPPPEVSNSEIWRSAKVAMERGVEHWQVNMMIDRDGVKLLDYFKLRLL
jgi:sugar fermentation stimulation protein A